MSGAPFGDRTLGMGILETACHDGGNWKKRKKFYRKPLPLPDYSTTCSVYVGAYGANPRLDFHQAGKERTLTGHWHTHTERTVIN